MFTLVAQGPQGYKVVRYNAFKYLDLKEGSDGESLMHVADKTGLTVCYIFVSIVFSKIFEKEKLIITEPTSLL